MSRILRATLVQLAVAALCAPTLGRAQSTPAAAATQPVDHAASY